LQISLQLITATCREQISTQHTSISPILRYRTSTRQYQQIVDSADLFLCTVCQ